MRILFLSDRGDGAGLAVKLLSEGNDVFLYIRSQQAKKKLDGIVTKVSTIAEGIQKAPDLIVFDTVGMGRVADKLKEEGWPVVGGSSWADKLELNKDFSTKAMETMGIPFQEGILGTEVSTEVWYAQGKPIPMPNGSIETKSFLHGDSGATSTQASVVFGYDRKEPRLVQQSVKKLAPLMEKIRFSGPLSVTGIVRGKRFYGVKFIPRFRYNAIYAFLRILDEPFGEMLRRVASGDNTAMRLKSGFGLGLRVSLPPYPYKSKDSAINSRIYSDTKDIVIGGISTKDWGERVYPLDCYANSQGQYLTAGVDGAILETTGYGISVFDAEDEAVGLYERVVLPQKQARLGDAAITAMRKISQLGSSGYEVPPFLPKAEPLTMAIAVTQSPPKLVSGGGSSEKTIKPKNSDGATIPIHHQPYNPGVRSG